MSVKINRLKAIKLLWAKARKHGFDSDYMHELLGDLQRIGVIAGVRGQGLGVSTSHFSILENKDLSEFLAIVFGVKVFIEDDSIVKYIKYLTYNDECLLANLHGVLKRYKKESLYQLNKQQKLFVVGFLKKIKESVNDSSKQPIS